MTVRHSRFLGKGWSMTKQISSLFTRDNDMVFLSWSLLSEVVHDPLKTISLMSKKREVIIMFIIIIIVDGTPS